MRQISPSSVRLPEAPAAFSTGAGLAGRLKKVNIETSSGACVRILSGYWEVLHAGGNCRWIALQDSNHIDGWIRRRPQRNGRRQRSGGDDCGRWIEYWTRSRRLNESSVRTNRRWRLERDTGTSGISNSGMFGSAGSSGSTVPGLLSKVSTGGDQSVVFHSFSSEAANSTEVVDRDGFALNHSAGVDVVNFASHGTDSKVDEGSWDSQFASGFLDWGV
jgi:hypothetical protein